MTIKTIEPEDKREKLIDIRKFHQETLDRLGIPIAYFICKMAYVPTGKTERFISLFPSEISRGEDVYIEFTSRELNPEDPNRCLYKYKNNPHYDTEYEKIGIATATGIRYLVPIAELITIRNYTLEPKSTSVEAIISGIEKYQDLPLEDMTLLDYIAIHLKAPVSNKEFLNDIISKFNGK